MDKKSQKKVPALDKKKVLVALTGRLDSMVSAYLLKKQDYKVYGLGIIFWPRREKEVGEGVEETSRPTDFKGVYLLEGPEEVRTICEKMEIPFYAADASALYQYHITDQMVAARLGGLSYAPKIYTTEMIFKILEEKAQKLGCYWVATGHYAKIIKSQMTEDCNVYVSNDTQHDQSYFLSRLDQRILRRTLLPLSEMRKQEVEKIGNLLGIPLLPPCEDSPDLMKTEDLNSLVHSHIPPSLFKKGTIIDIKNGTLLEKHEGLHQYFLGQKNLKSQRGTLLCPGGVVSQIDYHDGNIYLTYPEEVEFQSLLIKDFFSHDQLDITRSLDLFFKFHSRGKLLPVTLHFKNNDYVLVEFQETGRDYIFPGDYCVFYNRKGGTSRIMAGGKVKMGGVLDDRGIRHLPRTIKDLGKDKRNKQKKKGKKEEDGLHF